jgi:hypothetical protein
VRSTVIDWDGSNVPRELRVLPPGRYLVAPMDDSTELSSEEDAEVRLGLDDLKAGNVVPLDQVIRELGPRLPRT